MSNSIRVARGTAIDDTREKRKPMTADYVLGSSDLEHRRLMLQARILRPSTERFLRQGGLRPGMSVLDLGSGMGA